MVETVDRYGLKSRFLRKHLSAVDRFYRQISDVPLQSETAIKVKERLEKNRDKLFTFLIFDGVRMGLRPTHGDEIALLRFIDSKQVTRDFRGSARRILRIGVRCSANDLSARLSWTK
jgi:hypothetical protein